MYHVARIVIKYGYVVKYALALHGDRVGRLS